MRKKRMRNWLYALAFLLVTSGCTHPVTYVRNENPPEAEKPTVNVPKPLRIRNWVSQAGQGSCVHASTIYLMQWQGKFDLARKWKMTHSGGETSSSIRRHYSNAGLPYSYTESGDPSFIEWAVKNRYGCIVWWKPSHCCAVVHIGEIDGEKLVGVWDNNYPDRIEYYRYTEFMKAWRGFGGFAATVMVDPPATPIPWPYFNREER